MSADSLIHRFLEDRDSLADEELLALVEAVGTDADLAVRLREQLVVDDYLAQKLSVDRRQFEAQVAQRIRDLQAGDAAMAAQVNEVRTLVLDDFQRRIARHARWRRLRNLALLATSLLVMVAVGVTLNQWKLATTGITTLAALEGEVTVTRRGSQVAIEPGLPLRADDRLDTRAGASLVLRYEDGTEVQLAGGSQAVVGVDSVTQGKRVELNLGKLAASIRPQAQGRAMIFATPQAEALVLGTEIILEANSEETRLEVTAGRVQLVRARDAQAVFVNAEQLGLASREALQVQPIAWPVHHEGLTFLFDGARGTTAARSAATGVLREIDLHPRGEVPHDSAGAMHFIGKGAFTADAANADLLAALKQSGEFTLELCLESSLAEQFGPARVISFGENEQQEEFAVGQDKTNWVLRLQPTQNNKTQENVAPSFRSLGPATPGVVQHLVVAYRAGELTAWIDGRRVLEDRTVQGNFSEWQPRHLLFGDIHSGNRAWLGKLAAAAIYNRVLTPEQIAKHADRFRQRAKESSK